MSVEWIERFLFGGDECQTTPPELLSTEWRLQLKGISTKDTVKRGGIVDELYKVIGDLNILVEYFENKGPLPEFKTGIVTKAFNHLLIALAPDPSNTPAKEEDLEILRLLLSGDRDDYHFDFHCPRFWGELSRKLLNEKRPFGKLTPLSIPKGHFKNVLRLYDVTVRTEGQLLNPLAMRLVKRTDYLDPVHMKTAEALEAFVAINPEHLFSHSLRRLISRLVVDRILRGQLPILVSPGGELDSFLVNVKAIHKYVTRVTTKDEPPLLVDVFQRLLALCELDHLWQEQKEYPEEDTIPESVIWELTRKLNSSERLVRFLLSQLEHN